MINKWSPARWGRRTKTAKDSWEEIHLNNFKRTRPIVVCLSGNAAITNARANGFCKRAEKQLELLFTKDECKDMPVDLIGCAYGHNVRYDLPQMTEEERKTFYLKYPRPKDFANEHPDKVTHSRMGYLKDEDISDFVDYILMPECFNVDGTPKDIKEAFKNLSQITFLSWCHGDREVFRIFNLFSKKCGEKGLSIGDVYKLMGCCTHITYSPITRTSVIPTICIDSLSDVNNIDYSEIYSELDGVDIKYEYSDLMQKRFFDVVHILTSKLTNSTTDDIDEHSIQFLDRDDEWNIKDGHHNADCVSQMLSWVLCRSVENGLQNSRSETFVPRPTLMSLFQDLKYIKSTFNDNDLRQLEE
jgi:hypothetical protein